MALQSMSRAASLGQLARVTALAVPAPAPGVNSSFACFQGQGVQGIYRHSGFIIILMMVGSNWAGSAREPFSCVGAFFRAPHQLLYVQATPGQRRPDENFLRTRR